MPKICIVMATYNGEKYLNEMLFSLVSQTRKADLIIAIDDCSKDSTVKILNSYVSKLPLQIYFNKYNKGHCKTFEKGLYLAKQKLNEDDLIALADQDDIWLPNKLEIMEKFLLSNQNKFSMVFGDAQIINEYGKIIANSWRNSEHLLPHLNIKSQLSGFTNVTGCLMMFSVTLLKIVLPIPKGIPVHDQWITLCASLKNDYASINEPVIKYRIHGQNAIGNSNCHSWSKKLCTNLQWAITIKNSKLFESLDSDNQIFLKKYICYMESRLNKIFLPHYFIWLFKNSKFINPHVKGNFAHLVHSIFGSLGLKFVTHFLGRK